MKLRNTIIALAAAFMMLIPATADAGKERVRVATFKGKKNVKKVGKKVRSSVIKSIKKKHRVVKKDYKGIVKIRVRKKGRVYRVTVNLHDYAGDKVKTFKSKATRKGLSKKEARKLAKRLNRAITRLPDEPEPEPEPEDDDPEELAGDDDDDDDDDRVASSDDDEPEVSKKARPRRRGGLDLPGGTLAAGLAVTKRSFGFGLADMGNYRGAPGGGAYVNASLFPLAIGQDAPGWKGKLGIGVTLENSLGLKSKFPGDDTTLPTQMRRIGVDARYRVGFGDKKKPIWVSGNVGYESLSFTISNIPAGVTVMVPNTNYTSVTLGGAAHYPVTGKIGINAEAHIKVIAGAGDIVKQEAYGGTGSNFGFDVDANVEYGIMDNILIIGGVQYSQVSLNFAENGDLSTMGDFSKATDSYVGGYVTAGYRF